MTNKQKVDYIESFIEDIREGDIKLKHNVFFIEVDNKPEMVVGFEYWNDNDVSVFFADNSISHSNINNHNFITDSDKYPELFL